MVIDLFATYVFNGVCILWRVKNLVSRGCDDCENALSCIVLSAGGETGVIYTWHRTG